VTKPHRIYLGTHLRDFTKLKKLECEMENLLGLSPGRSRTHHSRPALVDVLPVSIETLTILDVDTQIIPQLQKLDEVKNNRFPDLRQVDVSISVDISDELIHRSRSQLASLDMTSQGSLASEMDLRRTFYFVTRV
jgi:hypothetical protein